jgi:hypothetical protein
VKNIQVREEEDSVSSLAFPSSLVSNVQPVDETLSPAGVEGHKSFRL